MSAEPGECKFGLAGAGPVPEVFVGAGNSGLSFVNFSHVKDVCTSFPRVFWLGVVCESIA